MASSDIYESKENSWTFQVKSPPSSPRSRHHSEKNFDAATEKDLSKTHRRRNRNSGLRRFRHQMKKPEFNRKFWIGALSLFSLILLVLILWDLFFRYPKSREDHSRDVYRAVVE